MLTWLREQFSEDSSRVELIPWTDAHSGNFDASQEAYTLVVDGNLTNISFAIEEGDANAPDFTKVDMTIPEYIAKYGVEIEEKTLNTETTD